MGTQSDLKILNSKLFGPRTVDALERERLHGLFAEIPKKKLTTVTAGAGYGKSTFVSQAEAHLNLNTVWYRLQKSDRDLMVFFQYLIQGVRKIVPQFGEETLQRQEKIKNPGLENDVLCTTLLWDFENAIHEDLFIVLDDYHLIRESREVGGFIQFFLEHLPPFVHVILVSRTDTGLSLARFRAMREALDITEDDLVFTLPEIETLFSELFQIAMDEDRIKMLHDRTGGWVSGLILFYHALQRKDAQEIDTFLVKLKGSHKFITSYLEENVFDSLPDDIKDFLLKTSILSKVDPDFCDQLLGINHSGKILKYLETNHLFTFPCDQEYKEYYYHHLFQDFLQTRGKTELGRKALADLHHNIAARLEQEGDEEGAIEHYLAGYFFDKACLLLAAKGMELAMKGKMQLVRSYLEQIPVAHLKEEPQLQYLHAKFLELSGKPNKAVPAYHEALNGFRRQKNMEGESQCLMDLGLQHYFTGDFIPAEKRLTELLPRIQDSPLLYMETLGLLILISSFLGKIQKADQYADHARSLLAGLSGAQAQGGLSWIYLNHSCRYICSGDFDKSLALAEMTLAQCGDAGFDAFRPLTYFQISWAHYFMGSFSTGYEMARKGLDIVNREGVRDTQYAWLLYACGLNSLGRGDLTAAANHARDSLNHFQKLGNRWGQGSAFRILCAAHRESGDMDGAWKCLDSAFTVTKGLTLPFLSGGLKGDRAELLMDKGEMEEIPLLLEDAEKDLHVSAYEMSRVYRLRACYDWLGERKKDALHHLLKGLEISEDNSYESWIVFEKARIAPLLTEAAEQGHYPDHIQRLMDRPERRVQQDPARFLKKEEQPERKKAAHTLDAMPPLRVHFLGKFRVFQGEDEIPAEQWKGEKPKMLFKYLVFARKRGYLPKDVLLELLWPEQDATRTLKRLNVALSSLRRSLEPNLKRGTPSSYVLRKKDAYWIDLGTEGVTDVEDFLNAVKRAEIQDKTENALSHYLQAEKIYQGHFLEEDLYEEWCLSERERLKQTYLNVLTKIIGSFEVMKNYQGIVDHAEKYLALDDCNETIYQALMRCYAGMGNRGMVIRTFERCSTCLSRNLSCDISTETRDLYDSLTAA